MARDRFTFAQREELHELSHWLREPVSTPMEFMVKEAVKHFLHGRDAHEKLVARGIPAFVVKRATEKARVILGNERAKRRMRAAEILARRTRKTSEFTVENFRVTIDPTQDRNYGMTQVSIYCMVEVWTDEDTVEKEYLVNFSDFKTKEWLTRLLVWALTNQREVLIKAATEVEMASKKMFSPRDKVPA